MGQIDLKCPACGYKFKGPDDRKGMTQEILKLCPRCPKWNCGLFCLALMSTSLILIFFIFKINTFQTKVAIGVFGLILDVWGGFLIATGYSEKIFAEVNDLGDENDEDLIPHLPKQTKRIRIGLILLILGFLFQALSQLF